MKMQHERIAKASAVGLGFLLLGWTVLGLATAQDAAGVARMSEVFRTIEFPGAEIDSLALWREPNGNASRLYVTGKKSDSLFVVDGQTGALIEEVGGSGTEPGRFRRPNGVLVHEGLLFVIERDNRRVQVLDAATARPLGSFGEKVLRAPYGGTVYTAPDGTMRLYVTDEYRIEQPGEAGERVKLFEVRREAEDRIDARLLHAFGAVEGGGVLQSVESILADPGTGLLFICDEDANDVKVYDLEGTWLGRTFAGDVIVGDPEGLALFIDERLPEGGCLVVTHQQDHLTEFHLYSRRGTTHLGAWTGAKLVARTDGIALHQESFGPFDRAAFYAVHDDISVVAFSFGEVLAAMGLAGQ
jgi:3-phytase